MTDLLPCPFCGSAESLMIKHMNGTIIHPAYCVMCDHCGASTGFTDRDHVAAWNTRAQPTDYQRGLEDAAKIADAVRKNHKILLKREKNGANRPVDTYVLEAGHRASVLIRDQIRALIATPPTPADPVKDAAKVPTLADIAEWFDAVANPTPAQSSRHMAADYRDRLRALAGDADKGGE